MASSSWKGDVIVWDMTTIKPKVQLNGHSEGVLVCFNGYFFISLFEF